jgi:hypothetical protein
MLSRHDRRTHSKCAKIVRRHPSAPLEDSKDTKFDDVCIDDITITVIIILSASRQNWNDMPTGRPLGEGVTTSKSTLRELPALQSQAGNSPKLETHETLKPDRRSSRFSPRSITQTNERKKEPGSQGLRKFIVVLEQLGSMGASRGRE